MDIVFANEEEAKAFTGKEPKEALGVIAKKCSIAIVKVGAEGSYIRKGTEEIKVSAIPVERSWILPVRGTILLPVFYMD